MQLAKQIPMAKKANDSRKKVDELQAKVLRRSEKLAKSLRQLVAQTEAGRSPAQKLLNAVESALPHLQPVTEVRHADGNKAAPKRAKKVTEAEGPRPVRTRRVAKKSAEQAAAPTTETTAA
jgi:uncharacterized protein YecE (DUF72 family)